MTPFDFINSVNNKTKMEWDDTVAKFYTPFIVNRGLSFNLQTILFANMMNQYPQLEKKMQYDFYFNGVPKGKRFDKWQKKLEASETIKLVREFYGINIYRAEEALKLLSNEQLDMIKQKMNKGGRK
jgi:hypothetical protein